MCVVYTCVYASCICQLYIHMYMHTEPRGGHRVSALSLSTLISSDSCSHWTWSSEIRFEVLQDSDRTSLSYWGCTCIPVLTLCGCQGPEPGTWTLVPFLVSKHFRDWTISLDLSDQYLMTSLWLHHRTVPGMTLKFQVWRTYEFSKVFVTTTAPNTIYS